MTETELHKNLTDNDYYFNGKHWKIDSNGLTIKFNKKSITFGHSGGTILVYASVSKISETTLEKLITEVYQLIGI